MIPYRYDDTGKFWWMARSGSPEVSAYTDRVTEQFILPNKDEEWADSQWWPEFFKKVKNVLNVTVGGWVFLWLLTWVVGWIVRGFLGIPRGYDRRIEKG